MSLAHFALVSLVTLAQTAASGSWLDRIQQNLQEREYELSWQDNPAAPAIPRSWHAPNRAHGFRTYFTEDGPRVIPRTGPASWEWGFRFVGLGRGPTLLAVGPVVGRPNANRIEYDRGSLVEWYV